MPGIAKDAAGRSSPRYHRRPMITHYALKLSRTVGDIVDEISPRAIDRFVTELSRKKKRVFLCGSGRTGLVVRAFALRLRHLGIDAWVIGEVGTPPVRRGDLFVACSRSGRTASVFSFATLARKEGARIAFIGESGNTPKSGVQLRVEFAIGSRARVAPLGTVFEHSLFLFFDSLVLRLMERLRQTERQMKGRHANLE